jgi:hypothetical protein
MKPGRREFMAAASLAAACGRMSLPAQATVQSALLSNERGASPHALTILFDEDLADSRTFAFRSRAMGARIVPLGEDIGALWFQSLMPLASSPGTTIAGLTRHADAFLLTRFAQGAGMRTTQRTAGAHAGPDTLVMWKLEPGGTRT